MKAIVQTAYGSPEKVLSLSEVDRPAVGDDQVLIGVRAASVHPDVWHVVTGWPYVLRLMGAGLRRPRNPIPGTDVAGVVEAVGRNVTRLQPGDEVFGETLPGMQWLNGGAYAQYVAAPESALVRKPPGVPFDVAACVPTAGIIAWQNLRLAGPLRPGQHVLINGAGGGVGTITLQLAKAQGARVTAVDGAAKLALLRGLGADHVIDHTQEDVTRGSERYDVIVDVASTLTVAGCKGILTPEGKYIFIGHDHYGRHGRRVLGSVPRALGLTARGMFDRHLPRPAFSMPPKRDALAALQELMEKGQLTAVIARRFPLAQAVAALVHVRDDNPVGRVVLTVD